MKVAVLMGGISSEREISLRTGENMYKFLNRDKYEVVKFILNSKADIFEMTKEHKPDFALLALHGKYGEDGQIQSILDALNIPYSGTDSKSSAVCMDKDFTKTIIKASGVRTAKWVVHDGQKDDNKVLEFANEVGYPVVVKPNSGGSSVETYIVKEEAKLLECIYSAHKVDDSVMVEQFIKGSEISVPIIAGEVLPTLLITSKDGFFDYVAKYQDASNGGATEEVIKLEDKLQEEVNDLTVKTYNALKCSVYARVDMIVKDGVPYVLEINTLPGMTNTSLIPRSAASLGIDYSSLLDIIIDKSLEERNSKIK